jgi:hypothetical protein
MALCAHCVILVVNAHVYPPASTQRQANPCSSNQKFARSASSGVKWALIEVVFEAIRGNKKSICKSAFEALSQTLSHASVTILERQKGQLADQSKIVTLKSKKSG